VSQFKKISQAHSISARRTAVSLMAATMFSAVAVPMAMAADEVIDGAPVQLETVVVNASADASAQGLSKAYAGGQVARGGRAGILGTKDNLDTPFAITSYTNELIQDQQAQSVGEVLQNDAGVRVARGYGNFQESYFIRGFVLSSDDVSYNGLYSLLPRQYIATELFERVEVLHGASAFLGGITPGGDGIGGSINLLPKRAPNAALTRFTAGYDGGQLSDAVDVARRFGDNKEYGVRVNGAYRNGETSVDNEKAKLGLLSVGLDWHSQVARLSADLGYQDNQLNQTRPSVFLGAVTFAPSAPDAKTNFAQPWTYSNERDLFGTLRGEYDIAQSLTAWAAYGLRRSEEANSLANPTVSDASTGAATTYRFDNARKDQVDTGELGLRWKLATGPVSHELVFSTAVFSLKSRNAYAADFGNTQNTNIYSPVDSAKPAISPGAGIGNNLNAPGLTNRTLMSSYAVGDTVGLFSDQLLITLGARHQQLNVDGFGYNPGYNAGSRTSYDKSHASPSVAVVYKASKMVSLYANYIEGLSQGEAASSDPTVTTTPGKILDPYVSKQKEVGAKLDVGRLGGGLAVFTTTQPRAVYDAQKAFVDSGKNRHQGAEFNVYGIAADGVRLLGGLTWLDAVQKETGSATTDGKRVIGTPRFLGNLGVTWDLPWADVSLDARMVYTGNSYYDAANTIGVSGWTRLDLGVRYGVALGDHQLTLRGRIDNVTDKNYWASVGGTPGYGYLTAGAPRTLGLSASMDF